MADRVDRTKETIKIAVIFPDCTKEEKTILKKAFNAFDVPVELFPYPSFKYQNLVKDYNIIVTCGEMLSSQLNEDVKQGMQVWHYEFPRTSGLIQNEVNRFSRQLAVDTIKKVKTKFEELQKKEEAETRTFTKDGLLDLTAYTIMTLCVNKIDPVVLNIDGREVTILVAKQKKKTKLDRNTFTLEELLVIKLVQELLGAEQVSIIEKEEEKR